MFDSDKDEKNIHLTRFKKNLEGKTVPEHIMKVLIFINNNYLEELAKMLEALIKGFEGILSYLLRHL